MKSTSSFLTAVVILGLLCGCSRETTSDAEDQSAEPTATSDRQADEQVAPNPAEEETVGQTRSFEFRYAGRVKKAGSHLRIWLPIPQTTSDQTVEVVSRKPDGMTMASEPAYGNRIGYFESDGTKSLDFELVYRIQRRELKSESSGTETADEISDRFLKGNKNVPLEGKHLSLLEGLPGTDDPLELMRQLYLRVDEHVAYDKSQPGYGNGDVLWVCDSRTGNCTDFHSLFIAWSRAKGIPARFEIGFPLPPERGEGSIGGYHCWAQFHIARQGWVPVDISEADKHPEMKDYYFGNLTENRVQFTVGRDLVLEPPQQGDPLNYFVYPYAESDDGAALAKDDFELEFSFRDVD